MFKVDCKFRDLGKVCTFKPDQCKPEMCDFYNLEYTVNSIQQRLLEIELEMKPIIKEVNSVSKLKRILVLEKRNSINPDVVAFKKRVNRLKDLDCGKKYLEICLKQIK